VKSPMARIALLALTLLAATSARADSERVALADSQRVAFRSERCGDLAWRQLAFESNAVLLAPALVGVRLGAGEPSHARWKGGILFDDDVRDGFASDSKNRRHDARQAANILLGVTVALPAVDMLARLGDGDCGRTMKLASDFVESFLLVSLLEAGTKIVSARQRPGDDDHFRSFFSGHAGITGAAAGLMCANAFKNGMWGERWFTRAAPCAVTTALASATGAMRLRSDDHWTTDVLVGLLVGFASGWFDLPNAAAFLYEPLGVAWLKDHTSVEDAHVMPTVTDGAVGLRLALRF
jgi:membrane-associated phospholipid phosphatase